VNVAPERYRFTAASPHSVALLCTTCRDTPQETGLVKVYDCLFPPHDDVQAAIRQHETSQHQQ